MDLKDPSIELHFRGHRQSISALCFHPTTQKLVTSSLDHSVMIWNFKQSMRSYKFLGHTDIVTCVDFTKSGSLLASSSRDR